MTDEFGPAPQYPIESVDRTLRVIALLQHSAEVKLSEVRDELGIGQSTAHRLMAMLVYRGFAVQEAGSRTYRSGPALFAAGRAAVEAFDLQREARPILAWLATESGETAHIGVLTGTDVRFVDVIESASALRVTGRIGQVSPAHVTSLGRSMLATLATDEVLRRYEGFSFGATPEAKRGTVTGLLRELRRTRIRGWAMNRGHWAPGVHSVGRAVVHPSVGLICAFSVATPQARSSPELELRHAALLETACGRLAAAVTRE